VQSKRTIQSLEENRRERITQPEDISMCHLYSKCQSAKLLSYHSTIAVHLHMEGGKVVDDFHHLVFHSIVSNIMNWPFFLDFVPIENDDEEEKEA
jgi:hypothetical protein